MQQMKAELVRLNKAEEGAPESHPLAALTFQFEMP